MQAIVGQTESHEHGGYSQMSGKLANDGDRSSAADENGFLAQNLTEHLSRDANGRMVWVDGTCGTRSQNAQLRFNARRCVLAHPLADRTDQVLRILIGNNT